MAFHCGTPKKMKITQIPKGILEDVQYDLIDVKLFQRNILDRNDFILLNSYQGNEDKIEILMELMRSKTEEDHNNFLEVMEEDYNWLRDKCEIFFQKIRLDALVNCNRSPHVPSPQPIVEVVKEQRSTEENDRSAKKSSSSPDSIAMPSRNVDNTVAMQDCMNKEIPSVCASKNKMNVAMPGSPVVNEKLPQIITSEMMTIVRRNHRVVRRWTALAHILGMTSIVHTLRMRMVMNGEDADACVLHLLEEWKGAHPKDASLKRLIEALREESFNDVADELEETFA